MNTKQGSDFDHLCSPLVPSSVFTSLTLSYHYTFTLLKGLPLVGSAVRAVVCLGPDHPSALGRVRKRGVKRLGSAARVPLARLCSLPPSSGSQRS